MSKLKIEYKDIDELIPYINNPRINDGAVDKVAASIKEFGFKNPIIIDKENVIIAGHTRLKAAKKLGLEEVPTIKVEDLTDKQIKAFRIADNKTSEFAEWDMELLEIELEGLDDLFTGFDAAEFDDIMGIDKEVEEDDFDEEPPENPISKRGDIWLLGRHRLMCGDATVPADVERLMDGKKADMVFTDPPYNIASDSKNIAADCSRSMYKLSKSEWDKNFDINELFPCLFDAMAEDCTVYICTSHFLAGDIWKWMKEWANHYSYCVWSKPNPMPSLTKRHWTWNTELVCYATRGKHIFHFPKEGHALSTWTINKKNGGTVHPTEKPVEVPSTAISFSSNKHQCVLDLFGGSGSTLIACEQLDRICYMMELDEKYVDVIVDRYINYKGGSTDVYLVRGGEKIPYNEVVI